MRPMYPGAMPNARLNLFNVVLVLDLSRIQALNFLVGPMSGIINRNIPIRFGLVPSTESEDGKSTRPTLDVLYAEKWQREENGPTALSSYPEIRA